MGQALNRMLEEQIPSRPNDQAVEEAAQVSGGQGADTLLDVLRPVLNFEKTDIEFWVQIAQLLVLIMILRRLSE